ncbi:MAG TPA: glycosyltransferase family 4 protein [Terriglobales bacterium]|jgi:glycosyltransferase involved in cell wall biosynthesis
MNPIRLLVDSFADEGLPNAQMANAREIICRLDSSRFHVSVFCVGNPDPRITQRPNTRLVHLPKRRQTVRIAREFLLGKHEILFYLKSSPASRYYLSLRKKWRDNRVVIGTVESQTNLRNEPTISLEAVRLWEQTILRCDHLFSNSSAVQKSLQREYQLPSSVIPTGVDTIFFTPNALRKQNVCPRVFFAGSLRPFKGPQLVLEAAKRFPGATFALAGEGTMAAELKSFAHKEKLQNVEFLGLLNAEELRTEYQRADIFLFPSRWEGSPKVILEAAACGLPVIARRDYEPETVIDGQTGYLTQSDSEIFQRLDGLRKNAPLRSVLGAAGRKHSEHFDWDVITRQWEQVFIDLAPARGRQHAA